MSSVRLQFVRGAGFSSGLIAYFGAGRFSHVDILMDDGTCLGARSDRAGGMDPGVRIRPANYEKWSDRLVVSISCKPWQKRAGSDFLKQQIGKPYDKRAILGFVTDRNWREDDAWFCSELATRYLEVTGICPKLPLPVNKVTPGDCALISCAVGGVIK